MVTLGTLLQLRIHEKKKAHNLDAKTFLFTGKKYLVNYLGRPIFFIHFGSLAHRPNIFPFLLILLFQPNVSKLHRQAKSIYFSTHFGTLAYSPNLLFFLRVLIVQPTIKKSCSKKMVLASGVCIFPSQYIYFSTQFGSLAHCKKILQKNWFQCLRYVFFFSCMCNGSNECNRSRLYQQ